MNKRNRVNNPEKFIWMVLKRHFSFVIPVLSKEDREDINQSGWVAALESGYDFHKSYNACQREIYSLAKHKGFRRTRQNNWKLREVFLGGTKNEV